MATRDLRAELISLTDLAHRDITKLLRQTESLAAAQVAVNDALPLLIQVYGEAAAALTADWYDAMRANVDLRIKYGADPAEIGDVGARELIGWAASQAQDPATFETLIFGGTQRRILNASRNTVSSNSVRDPGSGGWRRVGVGDNCPFCKVLIGRGAVYSEATVRFASHDHCNCVAESVWDIGTTKPLLVDANGKKLTTSQHRERSTEWGRKVNNERMRAWIADNPDAG